MGKGNETITIFKWTEKSKYEKKIFEGEITLNFGDELKCQMKDAGGRVTDAIFRVRFYANSKNYFLNMINKSQIKDI